jgi:KaiC/GvpD/RAD55 family RecA-like ATPase/tetratricopeptide (TPR) repeat protein
MKLATLADPVLVGRERELEELMRCLGSAVEGKGKTVFVSGEAGTGKTRLVSEFLEIAKEKDVDVLSSWCLSDLAVPYFPFMEAFNAYFASKNSSSELIEGEEASVKAWLAVPKQAVKAEKFQNLTPQGWRDLAVAAITQALLSFSARKVVILFIDDLQWADSASLSLLHYISRSIGSAKIILLSTYRSEELSPDPEGRPHPLLETLRLMRREGQIDEINLQNLDQNSVAALAEKMIGGSIHPELANRLAAESQGNPLFVVESLRMLSEHGSLVQDSGLWRLSIDEVGIPCKIKEIILRRVGMLKPNQRKMLDLASVLGEKFDVELLGAVLGQDSLEVLETLDSVAQSSSLVCCEGNYYEFDHAKSREAIYEQISLPLKKVYHARIAEKMEARGKDAKNLPVNDLAYHYVQAGNKEKAVEYALAAGVDALARFSNSEAERHYAYVLGTLSESTEHAGEKMKAMEGLGDALFADSLFDKALKTFEQFISIADSGAVKLRGFRKAFLCSYWLAAHAHLRELAAEAEEYAASDPLEYARLRMYRGFAAGVQGKTKEAVEDVEGGLRVFEEEFSLRDVAAALAELIFITLWDVPIQVKLAAGLRSVALYEELEDLRGQMLAHSRLGRVLFDAGLFRQVEDSHEKGDRIAEKIGDYNQLALSYFTRGMRLEFNGDLLGAVASSLKAVEYAEKTDAYNNQKISYGNLVREYAMLGKIELAEEYARKIDKVSGGESGFLRTEDEVNKAFLLSAKGQYEEANEAFDKHLEALRQNRGRLSFFGGFLKGFAWNLARQGRNEEAKAMLKEAQKLMESRMACSKSLEHAYVLGYLMAPRKTGVGEELSIRLDLVNTGLKEAQLIRVEGLIPSEFKIDAMPSYCSVQNGSVVMNEKELGAFTVEPLKLKLEAVKAGAFTVNPQIVYVDDLKETRTCAPQPVIVTVSSMLHASIGEETISVPILPDRITTGLADIDALLYGGIPEKYAVVLASPSIDEKAMIIMKFLEAGAKASEPTFYITAEAGNAKGLAEMHLSSFYLLVCNLQADATVEKMPNVLKLKGIESLTEIDIALTKAIRMLKPSTGPKRICIDIISDVLLQHHAVTTRKWLSELLPNLKSQGFTVVATINPHMHPQEEVQAILGLFDGEIRISERETAKGAEKVLRIRRLFNQKYLENELTLNTKNLG